jgi:hypothetical protein
VALPVIAAVLSAFYEVDNSDAAAPVRKRVGGGVSGSQARARVSAVEEDDADAAEESVQKSTKRS